MGMSAGDEQTLRRIIAVGRPMMDVPTAWMAALFYELDYLRGYVTNIECGGSMTSARKAANEKCRK